jgi:hypothetical protein
MMSHLISDIALNFDKFILSYSKYLIFSDLTLVSSSIYLPIIMTVKPYPLNHLEASLISTKLQPTPPLIMNLQQHICSQISDNKPLLNL